MKRRVFAVIGALMCLVLLSLPVFAVGETAASTMPPAPTAAEEEPDWEAAPTLPEATVTQGLTIVTVPAGGFYTTPADETVTYDRTRDGWTEGETVIPEDVREVKFSLGASFAGKTFLLEEGDDAWTLTADENGDVVFSIDTQSGRNFHLYYIEGTQGDQNPELLIETDTDGQAVRVEKTVTASETEKGTAKKEKVVSGHLWVVIGAVVALIVLYIVVSKYYTRKQARLEKFEADAEEQKDRGDE